jgi:hypothetical protein
VETILKIVEEAQMFKKGDMNMDKYYQEAKQYFNQLLETVSMNDFVQYLIAFNLISELMLEEIYEKSINKKLLGDDYDGDFR